MNNTIINKDAVKVVVGILSRYNKNKKIEYLFSQRPHGKPYAGYWEFAGGKIEHKETHMQALKRELREELGILININKIESIIYLDKMLHHYEHACVELHFYHIKHWYGKPHGLEGQKLMWISRDHYPEPILPSLFYILPKLS